MKKRSIVYFLAAILLFGCSKSVSESNNKKTTVKKKEKKTKIDNLTITSPKSKSTFTLGDEIEITISLDLTKSKPDSILVYLNNEFVSELDTWEPGFIISDEVKKVGKSKLKIISYYDENKEFDYLDLIFNSDIVPESLKYELISTYPHDVKAYTQGLVYEDGILYEGTGQKGESSLRKIDFKTGSLIESLSIPPKYFGEGIAIFQNKIIQLTLSARTGFIYDKNNFTLLSKFVYPTQGWGLTSDDEKLYMSDGSEKIYILEPEFLSQIGLIEVYDHNGPVKQLNELEYVNGLIYANVWQTDDIIVIDPQSGKVLKKASFPQYMPEQYRGDRDNVLNGIAYNPQNGHFYITGKRWPKLYEIKFK